MAQVHSSAVAAPTAERSDSELLSLVARKDLEAMAELYDRHIEAVWAVALQFSASAAAAERATANAFLRLWKSPQTDGRFSLRARLLATVNHEAHGSERVVNV